MAKMPTINIELQDLGEKIDINHIRDLLHAEQDGRLVVFPEPLKRAIVREGGRCFSDFTMDDINNLLEAFSIQAAGVCLVHEA